MLEITVGFPYVKRVNLRLISGEVVNLKAKYRNDIVLTFNKNFELIDAQ